MPVAKKKLKLEKIREAVSGIVYLIRCGETDFYKIGMTSRTLEERLGNLQSANPSPLTVIESQPKDDAFLVERTLHKLWEDNRVSPNSEWFELNPEEVGRVKQDMANEGEITTTKQIDADAGMVTHLT